MFTHARTRLGRIAATAAVGVAITAQSLVGATSAHAATAPQSPKFFDRKAVIDRAMTWVDKGVPYSQTDWLDNYRTDCSGFVSLAWGLDSSYVTWSLPEVAVRIDKEDLQPGDIILNTERHVVLFNGWADKAHTKYHVLEQAGAPHKAIARVVTYPYDTPTRDQYKPYRYTGGHDKTGHNIFAPNSTLPNAWVMTNAGGGSVGSPGSFADATNAKIAAVQKARVTAKQQAAAKAAAKLKAVRDAKAKAEAARKAAVKAAVDKAKAESAAKAAAKAAAEERAAKAARAEVRAQQVAERQPVIVKMLRAVVALFVR